MDFHPDNNSDYYIARYYLTDYRKDEQAAIPVQYTEVTPEPEMTNTTSMLYEKHPDWVIKAPKRDAVLGRGGTQLVLDLSNPKVQVVNGIQVQPMRFSRT